MNIKMYQQILNREVERGDTVIQNFSYVEYWFYFSNLKIFIPNLFLGYKNNFFEPYITWDNCGAKGKESRKQLEDYFKIVENKHSLYKELCSFAQKREREGAIINRSEEKITIYEPKNLYAFEQDKIDNIDKLIINKKYNEWKILPIIQKTQSSSKKPRPSKSLYAEQSYETLHEIVQRIKKTIVLINQNSTNHGKHLIFNDTSTLEVWNAIEESCYYKELFINFALKLYILIYETTRGEDPGRKISSGKPIYIYYLPDEFLKIGTPTRHFMDIVGTFRHHYAHKDAEYNNSIIKKLSYPSAIKELLGSQDEPHLSEDFQKIQIEILKLFENAMNTLLIINTNP